MKRYLLDYILPNSGNSTVQHMEILAPDSGTAIKIFKASYPNLKYTGSYKTL
jgi:hypothetical protein